MDTTTSPSAWGLLGGAAASGLATALFPPARIPVAVRRSLHLGLGAAAAGAVLWATSRPAAPGADAQAELDGEPLPLPARVAIASAIGSLVALSSVGGMALDSAAERALLRRGVRRPRVWIGIAAAGFAAATSYAESRGAVPPPAQR